MMSKGNLQALVMLYVDDMILVLEGEAIRTAMEGVMEVVKRFGHFLGQKLNFSKCHALHKGPNRHQVQELLAVYDIPTKGPCALLGD